MLSQRLAAIQPAMSPVQRTFVPFGEFKPDLGDNHDGLTRALSIFPYAGGYRSMPGGTVASDAIDNAPRGLAAARDTAANVYVYAGDSAKLYSLTNQVWGDVSKSGGYSLAADGRWEFAQFDQKVIATNFDDDVQSITLGGANFADHIVSTNKPKARTVAATRNFLILGNTNDSTDGAQPNRIWWSAIGDSTDFDPAAATQCGFQNIESGGWVRQIVAFAEYALIFMDSAIVRMTYEGPPTVWRFDVIDNSRGTPYPGSVITKGRNVYFLSEEGFTVTDGVNVQSIGYGKVDKYVYGEDTVSVSFGFETTEFHRVTAAVDPINRLIMWCLPVDNSNGQIIAYNYEMGWWSEPSGIGTFNEWLATILTQGYTLDSLDNVGTDIDNATTFAQSFDSRFWTGGLIKLAAFGSDKKLYTADDIDDPPQIIIRTGNLRFGRSRSRVQNVKFMGEVSDTDWSTDDTIFFAQSMRHVGTEGTTALLSQRDVNHYAVNGAAADNWYHRFQFVFNTNALTSQSTFNGIEVEWVPSGNY